jgi:spermidine/putrescine-binding protein
MRNKEVVMSMGYSGRLISLMNAKVPIAVSWDGAVRDVGYMSIPRARRIRRRPWRTSTSSMPRHPSST